METPRKNPTNHTNWIGGPGIRTPGFAFPKISHIPTHFWGLQWHGCQFANPKNYGIFFHHDCRLPLRNQGQFLTPEEKPCEDNISLFHGSGSDQMQKTDGLFEIFTPSKVLNKTCFAKKKNVNKTTCHQNTSRTLKKIKNQTVWGSSQTFWGSSQTFWIKRKWWITFHPSQIEWDLTTQRTSFRKLQSSCN